MSLGGSKGKSKSKTEQNQSFNQSTGFSGLGQQYADQARAALEGMNYREITPEMIQGFYNPYQQDVIDSAVNRINREGDLAANAQRAQFAQAGAFGDKRQGVYDAELAAGVDRNRSEAIANLMQQGYTNAQAAAMTENANYNQFNMGQGSSLANLLAQFAGQNTTTSGTSRSTGSTTGKNSSFGFSWAPKFG